MPFPSAVVRFAPFIVALSSFVLFWFALPAMGVKYAIFLVPAFWTLLTNQNAYFVKATKNGGETSQKRNVFVRFGRFWASLFFGGAYRQCWTAAFLFWLTTVVWVSYPHPATTFGWLALSGYLAFYFPFFIGITRTLTLRFRVPIWAAAPIAWTAVEWVRNRALGGFSFAGLSHALYDSPYFIQIAEPLGEYGVGALVVIIGALFATTIFGRKRTNKTNGKADDVWSFRFDVRPALVAAATLGATFYFGGERIDYFDGLERAALERGKKPFRLALLQDGTTYRFPVPEFENRKVAETYLALAAEAARTKPRFDAIIWPESCFDGLYYDFSFDSKKTTEIAKKTARTSNDAFDFEAERAGLSARRRSLAKLTARLGTATVLGTTSLILDENGAATFYNSAVFVPYFGDETAVAALSNQTLEATPTNETVANGGSQFRRYDKIRLVMFGEYIPFVEFLPDWFPLKAVCADFTLGRGAKPAAFELARRDELNSSNKTGDSLILAPNVCFESSIPQFIASQVRKTTAAGVAPDVLVNVSNDGWFRNGIQTDMHLATQVFRAIENRKAVVSATHGGFSAWIDPAGRVRACGKRGASEIVAAEILPIKYERSPIYWGEIFAAICAALGWSALLFAFLSKKFAKRAVKRAKTAERAAE